MADYGLTPKGPNIKRLDVIIEEMHSRLSEKWGVNTKQNPQSLISLLITNFADKIAELWEFGEQVYYSQYPSTAEGVNLDNAAQYGGTSREMDEKSYYPIHCTGTDGTSLAKDTRIASKTNPETFLTISEEGQITRSSFNKVKIKVAEENSRLAYSVKINDVLYQYEGEGKTSTDILRGLADKITSENKEFVSVFDEENLLLVIEGTDVSANNVLTLSENLTTETVTTILRFGTEETGDIFIPSGVITEIKNADAGLKSVVNLCEYIAGRKEQTDVEFRQSYIDKIFNRSSMMLDSIKSAILENVQGVKSVSVYENATNATVDDRPPHSIEVVVDGGDHTEIAKQILKNKAGGISTFGSIEVELPGINEESIVIRFNKPESVYVWMTLEVFVKQGETLPSNYADLLKDTIIEHIDSLEAGQDVISMELIAKLSAICTGISYVDIKMCSSSETEKPSENAFVERSIYISERKRAYINEDMIEVGVAQ